MASPTCTARQDNAAKVAAAEKPDRIDLMSKRLQSPPPAHCYAGAATLPLLDFKSKTALAPATPPSTWPPAQVIDFMSKETSKVGPQSIDKLQESATLGAAKREFFPLACCSAKGRKRFPSRRDAMDAASTVVTHPIPKYLTRRSAARHLGVSIRLLDQLVARKELKAIRPAKRKVLLDLDDLDLFMLAHKS